MRHSTDVGLGDFEPWPEAEIHLEWGVTGARLAASRGDAVIIVDVLSFSTSLAIACENDAKVLVYSLAEIEDMGGRDTVAKQLNALIVSKKRNPTPGAYSLSPSSLTKLSAGSRVIITSLNGATCVAQTDSAPTVLVGGLRNATETANEARKILRSSLVARLTIVPCGERWSSVGEMDGWRPCVEDWLGAGAIAHELEVSGFTLSVEAMAASLTYKSVASKLHRYLSDSVSGRELSAKGFECDISVAAQKSIVACSVVRSQDEFRCFERSRN